MVVRLRESKRTKNGGHLEHFSQKKKKIRTRVPRARILHVYYRLDGDLQKPTSVNWRWKELEQGSVSRWRLLKGGEYASTMEESS